MNPTLKPWLMLVIRSLLFLTFQALIALAFWIAGSSASWNHSAAWWPIAVILTNLVCLALLTRFYRQEGQRVWDIFKIERQFIKADLLFLLGFLLIAGPVGYLPNMLSARGLFGEETASRIDALRAPCLGSIPLPDGPLSHGNT